MKKSRAKYGLTITFLLLVAGMGNQVHAAYVSSNMGRVEVHGGGLVVLNGDIFLPAGLVNAKSFLTDGYVHAKNFVATDGGLTLLKGGQSFSINHIPELNDTVVDFGNNLLRTSLTFRQSCQTLFPDDGNFTEGCQAPRRN